MKIGLGLLMFRDITLRGVLFAPDMMRKSKSKYHNIKTVLDGYTFDSKKEARRYQDLILLQKAGEIRDLIVKPDPYSFDFEGVHICKYHPDFQYRENTKKRDMSYLVVEDVKGVRTPIYRVKAKLMLAFFKIKVREI